jgi:hypothetical protein
MKLSDIRPETLAERLSKLTPQKLEQRLTAVCNARARITDPARWHAGAYYAGAHECDDTLPELFADAEWRSTVKTCVIGALVIEAYRPPSKRTAAALLGARFRAEGVAFAIYDDHGWLMGDAGPGTSYGGSSYGGLMAINDQQGRTDVLRHLDRLAECYRVALLGEDAGPVPTAEILPGWAL